MRLADGIARHRLRYPRPIPTIPDLCVLDIPTTFESTSLPLGRYYPVIIEADHEWREWDDFLHVDRGSPIIPDLLDRRPSALATPAITIAHYDPPVPGWPWILLCHWPANHVAIVGDQADLFARRAYTVEIVPDPLARTAVQERLLHALGRNGSLEIVVVPSSSVVGNG